MHAASEQEACQEVAANNLHLDDYTLYLRLRRPARPLRNPLEQSTIHSEMAGCVRKARHIRGVLHRTTVPTRKLQNTPVPVSLSFPLGTPIKRARLPHNLESAFQLGRQDSEQVKQCAAIRERSSIDVKNANRDADTGYESTF